MRLRARIQRWKMRHGHGVKARQELTTALNGSPWFKAVRSKGGF